MKIIVHEALRGIDALQESIKSSGPDCYVPLIRNWLLAGPSFAEFEGLTRFVAREAITSKLSGELPQEKWAVVGGYTTRPLVASLKLVLLSLGIFGLIYESNYGAFESEVLGRSELFDFKPEHILIGTGYHHLREFPRPGATEPEIQEIATLSTQFFATRWERIVRETGAVLHQHSFCMPAASLNGRLEEKYNWSSRHFIRGLNSYLWSKDGGAIHVVDVESLQERIGSDSWWSARWFHHAKLPFNPEHLREYARMLRGHIGAVSGKSRKCLILDLDDTLWGGIVGEVGAEGVLLSNGDARGEEFLEFCTYVKHLSEVGIILAVVTKNELNVAQSVFETHRAMPLRLNDFAAFKASWQAKSDSVKSLQKELSISFDSLVFIDDNPAECAQVAGACPEVIVLQRSDLSGSLTQSLDMLRLFDRSGITKEDLGRRRSYQAKSQMEHELEQSQDIGAFLLGLQMKGECRVLRAHDRPRVAQLFAKTNQFNCTKKEFSETALAEIEASSSQECLVCILQDKYAEHGLVSSLVLEFVAKNQIQITNWVMSCRVFNRSLEAYILICIREYALSIGRNFLKISFIPTSKNEYVRKALLNLGFLLDAENGGVQSLSIDLNMPHKFETYIEKADV